MSTVDEKPQALETDGSSSGSPPTLYDATQAPAPAIGRKRARVEDPAAAKRGWLEAELRARHGPLTQLNAVFGALGSDDDETNDNSNGSSSRSRSGAPVDDGPEARRELRLRQLGQLPARCLPAFARLAECGVPGDLVAFAAIVATRAEEVAVQGWRASAPATDSHEE